MTKRKTNTTPASQPAGADDPPAGAGQPDGYDPSRPLVHRVTRDWLRANLTIDTVYRQHILTEATDDPEAPALDDGAAAVAVPADLGVWKKRAIAALYQLLARTDFKGNETTVIREGYHTPVLTFTLAEYFDAIRLPPVKGGWRDEHKQAIHALRGERAVSKHGSVGYVGGLFTQKFCIHYPGGGQADRPYKWLPLFYVLTEHSRTPEEAPRNRAYTIAFSPLFIVGLADNALDYTYMYADLQAYIARHCPPKDQNAAYLLAVHLISQAGSRPRTLTLSQDELLRIAGKHDLVRNRRRKQATAAAVRLLDEVKTLPIPIMMSWQADEYGRAYHITIAARPARQNLPPPGVALPPLGGAGQPASQPAPELAGAADLAGAIVATTDALTREAAEFDAARDALTRLAEAGRQADPSERHRQRERLIATLDRGVYLTAELARLRIAIARLHGQAVSLYDEQRRVHAAMLEQSRRIHETLARIEAIEERARTGGRPRRLTDDSPDETAK